MSAKQRESVRLAVAQQVYAARFVSENPWTDSDRRAAAEMAIEAADTFCRVWFDEHRTAGAR